MAFLAAVASAVIGGVAAFAAGVINYTENPSSIVVDSIGGIPGSILIYMVSPPCTLELNSALALYFITAIPIIINPYNQDDRDNYIIFDNLWLYLIISAVISSVIGAYAL